MSLNIKHGIIILTYALVVNIILVSIANLGIGLDCGELTTEFNSTHNVTDIDSTETKESAVSIIDIALNRCENLPYYIFILLELPIFLGLLILIRQLIGFT